MKAVAEGAFFGDETFICLIGLSLHSKWLNDKIKRDVQLMSCQCMMFIKRGEQNEIYICRVR